MLVGSGQSSVYLDPARGDRAHAESSSESGVQAGLVQQGRLWVQQVDRPGGHPPERPSRPRAVFTQAASQPTEHALQPKHEPDVQQCDVPSVALPSQPQRRQQHL
eukprot:1159226-Pelagomonas_calceolata.AAC.3